VPPRPSRPRPTSLVSAGSPGPLPLPSTPPLLGWLQGATGGPAVRGSPPPAAGGNREAVARALSRRPDPGLPPGPGGSPDEGQLLHHLRPSPPAAPGRRLMLDGASDRGSEKAGV